MHGELGLDDVVRRLDILIGILVAEAPPGPQPLVSGKVKVLLGLGLSPAEVAVILNVPRTSVNSLKSKLKRRPAKRGAKRGHSR